MNAVEPPRTLRKGGLFKRGNGGLLIAPVSGRWEAMTRKKQEIRSDIRRPVLKYQEEQKYLETRNPWKTNMRSR